MAKAALVEGMLKGARQIMRLDSPDSRVESGCRPNIIALYPGASERRLWLFAHLDVVPCGNLALWDSDPWQTRVEGDLVYGRGVEDNQQAIASMLVLAESLAALGITPPLGLGLAFMADEENGSRHGLQWILRQASGMFSPDDFFIVPDGGSPDASQIEVAEKAQLWFRFTIKGRQCHASQPQLGRNAFVAASRLVCLLQGLEREFQARNELFLPPTSTFAPTRHDLNVEAVNILPGQDVFFMDCRLLPEISANLVLDEIQAHCRASAKDSGCEITAEVIQRQEASSVSPATPVMAPLAAAIKAVYGVEARPCGIGGATVAAFLRQAGLPAVVWACLLNTCHQPNEHSSITATLKDACVFGHIVMADS